ESLGRCPAVARLPEPRRLQPVRLRRVHPPARGRAFGRGQEVAVSGARQMALGAARPEEPAPRASPAPAVAGGLQRDDALGRRFGVPGRGGGVMSGGWTRRELAAACTSAALAALQACGRETREPAGGSPARSGTL